MQILILSGLLAGNTLTANEENAFLSDDMTKEIQKMKQDMDQIFHQFHKKFLTSSEDVGFSDAVVKAPAVDIVDKGDHYLIKADIPGAESKSIKVAQKDGILTIEASTLKEEKQEGEKYIRQERFVGHFVKMMTLPVDADASKIKTDYKNGVLEVIIPKRKEK